MSAWDYSQHRDELFVNFLGWVCHLHNGVLTQCFTSGGIAYFVPISFESKDHAWKWIESGTIGELQEGLSNLKIGFSNRIVLDTNDWVAT